MSADFSVRLVALEELIDIETLDREVYTTMAYPLYVLRQLFEITRPLSYVGVHNGCVCGYAMGALAADERVGWILSVAVSESSRRLGMATELTQTVIAEVRARACTAVRLTVHPGNSGAISLYAGLGFVQVAYDERYFGQGEPRTTMELCLAED